MKQSKEERLIALTCALLAAPKFGLTKAELVQSIGGYRDAAGVALDKMFERDKADLRLSGVAIETLGAHDNPDDQTEARYRISRESFEWPAELKLTPAKLRLLELAARVWNARSIGAQATAGLNRLKSLGLVAADADPGIIRPQLLAADEAFEPLTLAIANQRWVRFVYRKADDSESYREVMPWRLRQLEGQWVLLASDGDQVRNFLLRRIVAAVALLDEQFEPPAASEILAAETDLEQYVAGNVAVLQVSPDSEAWWYFAAASEVVSLNYMDELLLAETLREFGNSVRVLEPTSLSELVRAGFEEVRRAHAEG